jgi:hypothetical protein
MLAPAPHDGASQSRGDDGRQGGQRILRGAPGWPAAPGERSPAPRSPAQARSPRTTDGFASSFASNRVSSRPSRSVPACRARGSRQRERPWRRATRRACLRVDRAAEAAWLADRPRAEVDDELVESRAAPLAARPRFLTSSSTVTATTPRACRGTPRSSGATASSAALQALAFDPGAAGEALRLLAARLGAEVDDELDEEPGKVLHELRQASSPDTS